MSTETFSDLLDQCKIEPLPSLEQFWFYAVLPLVALYLLQFVHEFGHILGSVSTGGSIGEVNFGGPNGPFLFVKFTEIGIKPVTIVGGPFLSYVVAISIERYIRFAGSCESLHTWMKYRIVGIPALMVAMTEGVYVLPIPFRDIGHVRDDGVQLYQYFQANPLWDPVTVAGLNISNPSFILGFLGASFAIYEFFTYLLTAPEVQQYRGDISTLIRPDE